MRLSGFIIANMPVILGEWDAFARTNAPSGSDLSDLVLRDHAEEILVEIARDIETAQTDTEQLRKSQGLGGRLLGRATAATAHGNMRHENEFSLLQLSAEFRALRATVLRLWLPTVHEFSMDITQQVVRFNEAIDEALADSIVAYDERGSRTRELFLAVLGHDLRSPVSTVEMVGAMMSRHELSDRQVTELGDRLQRSSRMMKRMIGDLLGFTRIRLGGGLPMKRRNCDLEGLLRAALADAQASHPEAAFELDIASGASGCWDVDRLHQLFMNLMVNAVQHGAPRQPVVIRAHVDGDNAVIDVTNFGRPIHPESLASIFKPLVQFPESAKSTSHPTGSLGLGLYIAREIAERHDGTINVTSSEAAGTTFTVVLPLSAECEAVEAV